MNPSILRLMFLTDPGIGDATAIEACVAAAIDGGATSIQLRDKMASDDDLIILARRLLTITRPLGVPLIINDRVKVVEAAGADGLHVGGSDMPPADARRYLAPGRLLGLSTHDAGEAGAVDPAVVDYIGVGPIFATTSKDDAETPIGCAGIAAIKAVRKVPAVAIGGISAHSAEAVVRAGCDGVAIISAIAFATDPRSAAHALRAGVDRAITLPG